MPTINKKSIGMKSYRTAQPEIPLETGKMNAQTVYNTEMWRKFRKSYFMEHPVYRDCGKNLAVDVHY